MSTTVIVIALTIMAAIGMLLLFILDQLIAIRARLTEKFEAKPKPHFEALVRPDGIHLILMDAGTAVKNGQALKEKLTDLLVHCPEYDRLIANAKWQRILKVACHPSSTVSSRGLKKASAGSKGITVWRQLQGAVDCDENEAPHTALKWSIVGGDYLYLVTLAHDEDDSLKLVTKEQLDAMTPTPKAETESPLHPGVPTRGS